MLGSSDINAKWKKPWKRWFYERILCSLFGELRKLLVSVFYYAFELGEFSSSQKQAVTTLIQKKDRYIMLIKS